MKFKSLLMTSTIAATAVVFAGAASAADIVEPPPPLFSWDGFYIGGNVGWGWAEHSNNGGCETIADIRGDEGEVEAPGGVTLCDLPIEDDLDFSGGVLDLDDDFVTFGRNCGDSEEGDDDDGGSGCKVSDEDENGDSLVYGLQAGVNRQYGSWVLGFEWDWTWADDSHAKKQASFEYFHDVDEGGTLVDKEGTGNIEIEGELDWLTTFRVRAGWAFGDEGRFLGYLTGGVAAARMDLDGSAVFTEDGDVSQCDEGCFFGDNQGDGDFTQFGWVAGIGGEWAVWDNVSIGIEWLHIELDGEEEFSTTFYADDGRSFDIRGEAGLDSIDIVRGKVNFLVNWFGN